MNRKPTPARPVIVYAVRHVWRGIYRVKWSDTLNYPRSFEDIYRKVGAEWATGEAHPTGCCSAPLRSARAEIARALNAAEGTA